MKMINVRILVVFMLFVIAISYTFLKLNESPKIEDEFYQTSNDDVDYIADNTNEIELPNKYDYDYIVKSQDNNIYLYDSNNNKIEKLDINYDKLREYDKKEFDKGVELNDYQDVCHLIEDFNE